MKVGIVIHGGDEPEWHLFDHPQELLDWWDDLTPDPDKTYHTVIRSFPTPPQDASGEDERFPWCPYCRHYQPFELSPVDPTIRLCEVCGISSGDYYVRKYNPGVFDWNGEDTLRHKLGRHS